MAELAHTNRQHLSMGKSLFLINLSESMFLLDPRDNQFNKSISISADYPMPGFFLDQQFITRYALAVRGFCSSSTLPCVFPIQYFGRDETSLSLLLGKKLYMVKFNNSTGELYIQIQRRLKFHQKRKPIHKKPDICDLQVAADTLEASSSQERDKQKRKRGKNLIQVDSLQITLGYKGMSDPRRNLYTTISTVRHNNYCPTHTSASSNNLYDLILD